MKILKKIYGSATQDCVMSVVKLLKKNPKQQLLDIGCWDGTNTLRFAEKIGTKNVYGIEINNKGRRLAKQKGIRAIKGDLNKKWGFEDSSMDVIIANQVIEHLHDTDYFVKEIKRVLKQGGYAVISTNNLSSWHNFVPLLLGYQPFPSDISSNSATGKLIKLFDGDSGSFSHLRIFTYCGLKELFEYYGFTVENAAGVGYYPFPKPLSYLLQKIDKRHSAYLTVKIRKPN